MGKRVKHLTGGPLFAFAVGIALTITMCFLLIHFFHSGQYIFDFFFRERPNQIIQTINTCLFFTILVSLIMVWFALKKEQQALYLEVPNRPLSPEDAKSIAHKIPSLYEDTLYGQRVTKLLLGHSRGEDIGVLSEDLSRQDQERFEKDFSFIDGLKYLILLLGFGGTVLGFYTGMEEIGRVLQNSNDVNHIIELFRKFGSSFSMAFSTTLLAIGYTVIILLPALVLHNKQKKLLTTIDDKSQRVVKNLYKLNRDENGESSSATNLLKDLLDGFEDKIQAIAAMLIGSFQNELRDGMTNAVKSWLESWQSEFSRDAKDILTTIGNQNGKLEEVMVSAIKENGEIFSRKVDEIGKYLQNGKSQKYSMVIKPVEEW